MASITKHTQKVNLLSDQRSHAGVKEFKCDEFNKSFTRVGHVNMHKKIHTDEKDFKCDKCDKAFTLNIHLRSHLKSHSDVKEFKCDQCKKCPY